MKKLLAVFVLMLFVSTSFAFAVHEDIGTGEPDNIETVQSITLEHSVLVAIDLQTHTDFIVNDHVVWLKRNHYLVADKFFIVTDAFKRAAIPFNYYNIELLSKPPRTPKDLLNDLSITNYWYRNYKS